MHEVFRPAAKAGTWYEGTEERLLKQLKECFLHPLGPQKDPKDLDPQRESKRQIFGIVSPHAGYMYSGPTAARGYYALAEDRNSVRTVVLLGPNHTGWGKDIAIFPPGMWETPLGIVKLNSSFILELAQQAEENPTRNVRIGLDEEAHAQEHSLEMQVPFLQYIFGDKFRLVPICMLAQEFLPSSALAKILYPVMKSRMERGEDIIVVASSDFSHYVPHDVAVENDKRMIDEILRVDPEKMNEVRRKYNITACGYGPITTLLLLAKRFGFDSATLLGYSTSGDISGDKSAVVGYASIAIHK